MAMIVFKATAAKDPESLRALHVARLQDLANRCRKVDDRRVELAALRTEAEIQGLTKTSGHDGDVNELLAAALDKAANERALDM